MVTLDGLSGLALKPRMRAAGRMLGDLLLPPRALDAQHPVGGMGLSAPAWGLIRFLDDPVCDGCGAPFEHGLGEPRCVACTSRPRVFARARAACLYDDASRELILKLKHADRTDLAGLFSRWLSRAGCDLLADAEVVCPVPLHRLRLLRRKYNQAAEMARPLARRSGLPYLPDALVRARAADSQAGKSASGRRRNVAAAFRVPEGRRRLVDGRRVLLIDDVMTTGATAESCARALLKGGAAAVDVLVVARVLDGRAA